MQDPKSKQLLSIKMVVHLSSIKFDIYSCILAFEADVKALLIYSCRFQILSSYRNNKRKIIKDPVKFHLHLLRKRTCIISDNFNEKILNNNAASHVYSIFIVYFFLEVFWCFCIKFYPADNITHLRFPHFKLQKNSSVHKQQ